MNILYIAYSCDPYNGSEDKIGWCITRACAEYNRVYVITKAEHRVSIECYLKDHSIDNATFFFVDIPRRYKKFLKGYLYSGRLNLWNKRAFLLAVKLCALYEIDIIHQITPVEFRAIGDYGKIPQIKFVCGPVGGGESIANGLRSYAKKYVVVEAARCIVNQWYRMVLSLAGKLKRCDHIMYANEETSRFLRDRAMPTTEIGIDKNEIDLFDKKPNSVCTFLVVGRVVYRKGHKLLLEALTQVPESCEYICQIIGTGSELKKLKKLCKADSRLTKRVIFRGAIPHSDMAEEYKKADVLIMPSIRETTGSVLLEAMSKGLPVITINKFGGATIIDDESGWLYSGKCKKQYINSLRDSIVDCIMHPDEVSRRGHNARKKACEYTWDKKMLYYQNIYNKLLKNV